MDENIPLRRRRYQLMEYLIDVLWLEDNSQYYHMIDITVPVKPEKNLGKKAASRIKLRRCPEHHFPAIKCLK